MLTQVATRRRQVRRRRHVVHGEAERPAGCGGQRARHRHPRRAAAPRRPLRLRALQGPPRGGRRPGRRGRRLPGHQPPPGARCEFMVGRLRNGLAELFALPDGYEVVLGNGGTTAFWDIATFGLDRARAASTCHFGEFSSKFAAAAAAAPFLDDPRSSSPSPAPTPSRRRRRRRPLRAHPQRDLDRRGHGARAARRAADDGRSCSSTPPRPPAGCASTRPSSTSTTSPRRSASPPTAGSGSPPCSPAAIERIERIAAAGRWIPAFLDLSIALETRARTRPTTPRRWPPSSSPAEQVEWVNENGGLEFAAGRCDRSAEIIYGWAEASRLRHALRRRPGRAQPRRRHHRPRRRDRRRRGRARCCAPTASSTPSPTASSGATSCGSRCSRRSSPTTSRP